MPRLNELVIDIHSAEGFQKIKIDKDVASMLGERFHIPISAFDRCSWMLLIDLAINLEVNGVNPFAVVDEIKSLEGSAVPSGMKPPIQFKHPPLAPLWHQHYFSARFLARNIHQEFIRGKTGERLVREIFDPTRSEYVTAEMVNELSHRVTHGFLEQRRTENRTTGEWIVFAEQDGKKYYLCMATHTVNATQDQKIYDKLKLICRMQFPFLEPFASDRTLDALCSLE